MKKNLLLIVIVCLGLGGYAQIGNESQGTGSGINITSGDYNTLYGDSAGFSVTSGLNTTMIGYKAGMSHTSQSDNTFIGAYAGEFAITGTDNVFIGKYAGRYCDGTDNTVIGTEAGMSLLSGASDNTFVGEEAGQALTTGDDNVFIGEDAGFYSTTSSDNTFVGNTAGRSNTTGYANAFFGDEAGYDNTTGYWNTAVGDSALIDNRSGFQNTALGHGAGCATEYASHNTFVGAYAGGDNNRTNSTSNANRNTYLGTACGFSNREGSDNVGIGSGADFGNNNRSRCVFIGGTGYSTYGQWSADGFHSVNANDATSIGYQAQTDAVYGIGIGHYMDQHGVQSISMGYLTNTEAAADYSVLMGSTGYLDKAYSVGLGYATSVSGVRSIGIGANTSVTSDSSIVIGAYGAISGMNSLALGQRSNVSGDYSVAIGYGAATSQNNSLVLGGLTATDRVSVGIGTASPSQAASLELAETNKGFLVNRLTTALRTTLGSALAPAEKGMMVFDTDENALYTWDGTMWNSSTNTDSQDLDLAGNTLSLSNDGTTVDLSAYLDNTDTQLDETAVDAFVANNGYLTSFTEVDGDITNEIQDITLSGSDLTISSGSTIDLSVIDTDTDTQLDETAVDAFVANNGYLTSFTEMDGDATNEIQDITLSGSDLTISSGSTIDLSIIDTDTDTQLDETAVDAFVANNGYLTSFTEVDGDATNEIQDITLSGSDLTISSGSTIDLSSIDTDTDTQLDETAVDAFVANNGYLTSFTEMDGDATNEIQDITLSGSDLTISSGSTIDLSVIQDGTGTDEQTLALSGYDLSISNGNSVDLTTIVDPLVQMINELSTRVDSLVNALDVCCNDTETPELRSTNRGAELFQNIPNPWEQSTTIKYYLPENVRKAQIQIHSTLGVLFTTIDIDNRGNGHLLISSEMIASGTYVYSLIVDNKLIDTKKFILTK